MSIAKVLDKFGRKMRLLERAQGYRRQSADLRRRATQAFLECERLERQAENALEKADKLLGYVKGKMPMKSPNAKKLAEVIREAARRG